MKKLIVSAGGKNTRIKNYLENRFFGIPKHILPLPKYNTTLLEKIVRDALPFFSEIVITTNENNFVFIKSLFNHYANVVVIIDRITNGPLGPLFRELLEKKEVVYACAGDFFCNFSWKKFNDFHYANKKDISILVAKSEPTKDGARFILENNIVKSWERVNTTMASDRINIGCYIINPNPNILSGLESLPKAKEDDFFDFFIPKGDIAGFDPKKMGFNVNTPSNYEALCNFIEGK